MARSRSAARAQASSGRLAATAASVPRARRFVRQALRGVTPDPDVVDVAMLLVSELVTNAVMHAASQSRVEVAVSGDTVRVEVHDDSEAMPRPPPPEAAATGRPRPPLGRSPVVAMGERPDAGRQGRLVRARSRAS